MLLRLSRFHFSGLGLLYFTKGFVDRSREKLSFAVIAILHYRFIIRCCSLDLRMERVKKKLLKLLNPVLQLLNFLLKMLLS